MRIGPLSLLLLLFVATGCGAPTTAETSSPARPTETSSGGSPSDPKPAPTCDDTTDFETNPQHCGRCGRACDDNTCTRGMCKPRLEGDSSALAGTVVGELGVVEGRVYAGVLSSPRTGEPPARPLVRFDGGKPVTVVQDRGLSANDPRVEHMRSDGKTVFVGTLVGGAMVLKRFAADGTAGKDVLVPEDGYGFPQMSADDGRLLLRGIVGPMALFGDDGKAKRLPELRNVTWATLSGADIFLAGQTIVERMGLDGKMSTVGEAPDGVILSMAVGKSAVFALTTAGESTKTHTLLRFPRGGNESPPDLTAVFPAEALEAMNAATLKAPVVLASPTGERSVEVDGRVYFTMLIQEPKVAPSARVIVEWSEARGFRPFATLLTNDGATTPTRLEVSNGRLYWLEQPHARDDIRPPWRILSAPL